MRLRAIAQRVAGAEYTYHRLSGTGSSESISAVLALLLIVSGVTAIIALHEGASWWHWPALAAAALLPIVVYRAIRASGRDGVRFVEPYLAKSLAPIRPTNAEIRSVCHELAAGRFALARKLRPERLVRLMEQEVSA